MKKPERKTYNMSMFLHKTGGDAPDIRTDADVQREAGQWDKSFFNNLMYTILSDDYVPAIILGKETNGQMWIIDGLQRTTSMSLFRYGGAKITKSIRESIVEYQGKKYDKDGNVEKDKDGNIIYETVEYDITNKKYEDLPKELKDRFDEFQVETVIHNDCDSKRISTLIERYNNQKNMNVSQKAFTHLDRFARKIKTIRVDDFFTNFGFYSNKDMIKGNIPRIIIESVMAINHIDNWKSSVQSVAEYLNRESSNEEFENLHEDIRRLSGIVSEDMADIFTVKETFIWIAVYDRFKKLNISDGRFRDFIYEFKNNLRSKEYDGKSFDMIDKGRGTKDTTVVNKKINMIETLMKEYLASDIKEESQSVEEFVKSNVTLDEYDMELYSESLNDLLERTVKIDSKLRDKQNEKSLMAMVAYSYEVDEDLDDWLESYAAGHDTYEINQKENFLHMKEDFDRYLKIQERKSA